MISIVIPVYKNWPLFLKNLKTNLPFLKGCKIIIINDNPEKSLTQELKDFKNVILIENKQNLGFGLSVNVGVQKAEGEYVMLLNDDVKLLNSNYQLAINDFQKDDRLFAISFMQKEKDGSMVGKNVVYWKNGLFFHKKADDLMAGENGWAEGGACIIRKKIFLDLQGFDPLFKPFYWEDIDMSYRAKKAGYKTIFDPNIVVEHHHESTIGQFNSSDFIKTVSFRNQFLFIWKNANLAQKILHVLFLPFNLLYYLLKGEPSFVKGFFRALTIS